MKGTFLSFILFFLSINISYGYYDCPSYYRIYEKYKYQYQSENAWNNYKNCINKQSETFNNGYNSYNNGRFEEAINYYKEYFNYNTDSTDIDYKGAKNNLKLSYKALASVYFDKKDFNNAIENYKLALAIDNKDYELNYNIGSAYYNLGDYNNSLIYYQHSYNNAIYKIDIDKSSEMIKTVNMIIENKELLKNAPTNDTYSGYQYYLKQLNIPNAWKKVTNSKEVIVAVIDDGLNINHPDLYGKIWTNKKEIPGDGIDNDKNGYIDDYNGWNFASDNITNLIPSGTHGTMVSGIIGAGINNNQGISGIAKNVKIMSLRVFETKSNGGGAFQESIINAINYAIDNGANIINLSLIGHQWSYTKEYDNIIKKAYDKGVIVVIAAGNGDILSGEQSGVNLDVNKLSPICNNAGNYKRIIGVSAFDKDGYRTNWTNYGNCAYFFAFGEGIYSTAVPLYLDGKSEYGIMDGTSFSAPQISGIIALGFNQYGKISPDIVWDSLYESLVKNSVGNTQIDASKYIDILGQKVKHQQNIVDNENKQKQKAEVVFNKIKKKVSNLSENKRKATYNSILKQLNGFKGKIKGNKEIILNHLIFLINQELLNNDDYIDLGNLFNN